MYQPDMDGFRSLLDAQALLFGRDKPDDLLLQAYWQALKDLPLETVKACAAIHAKRGKFFPKPAELRPKSDRPDRDMAAERAHFATSCKSAERKWNEALKADPERTRWRLLESYVASIENRFHPDDPAFDERMSIARGDFDRLLGRSGGPERLRSCIEAWRCAVVLRPALARAYALGEAVQAWRAAAIRSIESGER
jgi:hypothetical protein